MTDLEFDEIRCIAILLGNTLARLSPRGYRAQLEAAIYMAANGRSEAAQRMQEQLKAELNKKRGR